MNKNNIGKTEILWMAEMGKEGKMKGSWDFRLGYNDINVLAYQLKSGKNKKKQHLIKPHIIRLQHMYLKKKNYNISRILSQN